MSKFASSYQFTPPRWRAAVECNRTPSSSSRWAPRTMIHGYRKQFYLTIRIWLPICATTRASRSGTQPDAFELVSMVATIGNQNHDSYLVTIFFHHADEPQWNATARLRACLDGSNDWKPERGDPRDPPLVTNLRHHADEPPWNATARLRACLDGGDDWQPEPRFASGCQFKPPRGRAAVECDHTPSIGKEFLSYDSHLVVRIW